MYDKGDAESLVNALMHNLLMVSHISSIKAWYRATRPFTLSASIVPVLVGTFIAWRQGNIDILLFLLTLFGSVLIQIGTNLSDEYSDHTRGSYKSKFPVPHKVILQGLLSPRSVKLGAHICFGLAALMGIYLVIIVGWAILLVGVASIAAGYFYSAGRLPLGNLGLGEPVVFIFMGILPVAATYYIQVGTVSRETLLLSLPVGFLVTAILVANNLRDVKEDAEAGKVTSATQFGEKVAALIYIGLVAGAFLFVVIVSAWGLETPFFLVPLLSLPQGILLIRRVWKGKDRPSLNIAVRGTAILHMQFGLLMSAGLLAMKYFTWG